jgi:hypothetical protein
MSIMKKLNFSNLLRLFFKKPDQTKILHSLNVNRSGTTTNLLQILFYILLLISVFLQRVWIGDSLEVSFQNLF